MTFVAEIPDRFVPERSYAVRVVLETHFGHRVDIVPQPRSDTPLALRGYPGEITVADEFFAINEGDWLTERSLPARAPLMWDPATLGLRPSLTSSDLPVILGEPARSS